MSDRVSAPLPMVNVQVDGVWKQFPKGTRLIEACEQAAEEVRRTRGGVAMAKFNPFVFLQEVRSEGQKVTWPTRRETMITTLMVLAMVLIASLFFVSIDQIIRLAVAFVIAVAIGLSGLLLFAAPAIRSIGIAGALVVISSVFFALTFLPAVLGMLGPRVNALPLSGISRRFRRTSDLPFAARTSRWERVALAVMKHPIRVMIPTLAVLLIAGIPYFHMVQGVPGAEVYPPGVESRDAYVALQTEFAPGETTPIIILADVTGSPTDLANIKALDSYASQVDALADDALDERGKPIAELEDLVEIPGVLTRAVITVHVADTARAIDDQQHRQEVDAIGLRHDLFRIEQHRHRERRDDPGED